MTVMHHSLRWGAGRHVPGGEVATRCPVLFGGRRLLVLFEDAVVGAEGDAEARPGDRGGEAASGLRRGAFDDGVGEAADAIDLDLDGVARETPAASATACP